MLIREEITIQLYNNSGKFCLIISPIFMNFTEIRLRCFCLFLLHWLLVQGKLLMIFKVFNIQHLIKKIGNKKPAKRVSFSKPFVSS